MSVFLAALCGALASIACYEFGRLAGKHEAERHADEVDARAVAMLRQAIVDGISEAVDEVRDEIAADTSYRWN